VKNFTNKALFSSNFSKTYRIFFFFLLNFSIFHKIEAQTYSHSSIWSRVLVSKQINPKWFVSAEMMLRRQNNYLHSKYNFLEKPLLDAQRIVVAYRLKRWQFSFAPSRWYSYQILGKAPDFDKTPTTEWRFTPTVEYFHPIRKATLSWRTQYEYRYFTDKELGRFRQRIQYRMPINKTNNLLIGNESLWGMMPNSSKKFEQNQLYCLWLPKITKHLEAEFGYRYVFRRRRTSDEIDNENALTAGLFIRL
jgi:hypothetical protein